MIYEKQKLYFVITSFSVSLRDETALMKYTPDSRVFKYCSRVVWFKPLKL